MIDRRYQVFISSTYADLIDERREVIQALLELDCIPAGMELFPAADEDAWSLIARVIDDCDYYILIMGGRYGSISEDGISYTEREYDYAVAQGKPVLAFIHSDPELIPAGKTEIDAAARRKLDTFRAKVRKRLVRTYTSAHELGSAVSRSLVKSMKDKPGEGWVRGRYAVTPELSAELSSLRAQLAEQELELKRRELGSAEEEPAEDLSQGSDAVHLFFTFSAYNADNISDSHTFTWDELLVLLGPSLLNEAQEKEMVALIQSDILINLQAGTDFTLSSPRVQLLQSDFNRVKVQLRALKLIDKGVKKRAVADKGTYWTLTDRGDRRLVELMAIKRSGDTSTTAQAERA